MNNSINLIDYRGKINTQSHDKKQRPLRIIAIALLFIVSASSIIFFILIALSPLPELKIQYSKQAAAFALTSDEVIKQEITKERVGSIKSIIEKRSNFDAYLEYLRSILPQGVEIDAISIDKNNISIAVSSQSLLLLDDFLEELTSKESEKRFSQVRLKTLSNSDESGGFLLTLGLNAL